MRACPANVADLQVHALEAAAIYYKDFLTRVHSYGIINTPLPWAATDGDEGAENARLNVPRDPALARQAKIDALVMGFFFLFYSSFSLVVKQNMKRIQFIYSQV
jgi:hypothetical protein